MEANKMKLVELIGGYKKRFNIPVYQRNYDWKNEHCIKLFKDIENIANTNFEARHFLGTIVYVEGNNRPNFLEHTVIDGQQRITSIMLLIKALHDSIDDNILQEDILETYLINPRVNDTHRLKLKPIESDMGTYEQIISNKCDNNESNLYKNYSLFLKKIEESPLEPLVIYNALSNIEIVYIKLDKGEKAENPQLIFESLNSTGLSLTQADLIRNLLLMNHDYDEQERLYKDYWLKIEGLLTNENISDFIRDYLTMKMGAIPKKDKVYDTFKAYIRNNPSFNEEGYLEELLLFSKYYSWFLNSNSPNKHINDLLNQLKILKSTVSYPLLLYVFEDCYSYDDIISEENLLSIIEVILSYLYRRLICSYKTNVLNTLFASLPNDLSKKELTGVSYCDYFVELLATKPGSGRFPRDEEFKNNFIIRDLYKTKIDKYTLLKLENNNNKEVISNSNEITIEHIMPQRLRPEWQISLGRNYEEIHNEYLHTIGNLTLSGYNSELSNKTFSEKKKLLSSSNISLNRNLSEYENWNELSIKDRARKLFDIAKEIWSLPEKYNKQIKTTEISYDTDYNIMESISVTGNKPSKLIIMDTIHNVSSWKDLLFKLCYELNDLDANLFKALAYKEQFCGTKRKIISTDPKEITKPQLVADNVYVETNLSANDIINYGKLIAENYEMQDDIFYRLKNKHTTN